MHVTVWEQGRPVRDFDLSRYGDTPEARAALQDLVDFLNAEAMRAGSPRRYDLSEMGEVSHKG